MPWRTSVLTLLAGIIALLGVSAHRAAASETGSVTAEEVSFEGADGVSLGGTVVFPASEGSDLPAMALVHGSGDVSRERLMPLKWRISQDMAWWFSSTTRTQGYSRFDRDYSMLGTDALSAVETLRGYENVDQDRVGLWGLSEGGWVAPIAAATSDTVVFLITVAANGGPPVEQEQWNLATKLDRDGVKGSLVEAHSLTLVRLVAGAGLLPEAFHDPIPVLRQIHQPVLALWGEHDRLTPPGESLSMFRETFESSGHTSYTLRIIPDAGHSLHQTPDGGFTETDQPAPGYVGLVSSWVDELASGPPESSVDSPPTQERKTVTVEPLAWHESPRLQLGAAILLFVGFAGPLGSVFMGRSRSPMTTTRRSALWMAVAGLAVLLGFLGYVGFLQMTAAETFGPIAVGRPLPWLALQAMAIAIVAAFGISGAQWWVHRGEMASAERLQMAVLLIAGIIFVPWAAYWGLLYP